MTGGPPPRDNAKPMFFLNALALSLIMPWVACQRAWREAGIGRSLLYHVLGVAVFLLGLVFIDTVLWYGGIINELDYLTPSDVPILLLGVAFWAIGIELGFLFLAWWTSCWGADIERYRTSFARSVCRWYQLTPFLAVWTLALIVSNSVIDEMRYNSTYYDYGYDSFSWQFNELFYNTVYFLTYLLYFGIGGWYMLRALAVPRSADAYRPKCRWPALCETCGYTIVGLAAEQTCPECGRLIGSSLHTPRGNAPLTTLGKMRLALFNPSALGESIQTRTRTPDPARALALTAFALLLTGPLGVAYMVALNKAFDGSMYFDNAFEFLQMFIIGGLSSGLSAMVLGVLIVLGTGSIVSLVDRVFGKRNNLPAACRAACYASGYVVFMALLMFGFTGAFILIVEHYLDHMGFGLIALIPLVWISVCLLLTLPYFVIVGRIVRSTRWANV